MPISEEITSKSIFKQLEVNQKSEEQMRHDIGSLQSDVSSIGAKLDSLTNAVATLAERSSRPTNWIGLGSLMMAIVIGFTGYVQTRLSPTESIVTELRKEERLLQFELGKTRGRVDLQQVIDLRQHEEQVRTRNSVEELGRELSGLIGKHESLHDEFNDHKTTDGHLEMVGEIREIKARMNGAESNIRDVDHGGSRLWNKQTKQK